VNLDLRSTLRGNPQAPARHDTPPDLLSTERTGIRCREIRDSDIEGVVNLLTKGFGVRPRLFWAQAFQRLSQHQTPPTFPKYGYLLEDGERPVGVLILVFSSIMHEDGTPIIRCSVSSWYTDPAYRIHAAMLASRALRLKAVTYFNITPHPNTVPALVAQGYSKYCDGAFICFPALRYGPPGTRVRLIRTGMKPDTSLPSWESDLLFRHSDLGCVCMICSFQGHSYPFIFLRHRGFGMVPCAYLTYCRKIDDFSRFAGPLGRFLLRYGISVVELDANGALKGLVGKYLNNVPKYFKGPAKPRLGDICYSERVMFGF